ncbi:MAG: amidohydrolase [Candidatus Bathyarchaeia archaeon]
MGGFDLLIYGCKILPMNVEGIIENGVIAIKNGKISRIGRRGTYEEMHAEYEIDAEGKIAMPGLVNCHTHVAMTLFRGLAEDKPLNVWLKDVIWPLEARLKSDDVYVGALLGCLEMIKSGTTCFADMYFYEEAVARAVFESGLRAVLAEGIIESGNRALGERTFIRSVNFAKSFNGYAEGRVTTMLGPHAVYSLSRELLENVFVKAFELGVGVHMHLAESWEMFKDFENRYGCSEVEFLDKIGFFGRVVAAHCLNLSDVDRRILAERRVNVVYVPVANMKLGLGAARVRELLDLGVNVALGTDGPASNNTLDMFETMKVGVLLQKLNYLSPEVFSPYQVLRMATVYGAQALGIEKDVGTLEVGKRADIILVDVSKPHLRPLHNVYASLVYSACRSDVDTVIVDGKILMENRRVKTLDEGAVMDLADRKAEELLTRKS